MAGGVHTTAAYETVTIIVRLAAGDTSSARGQAGLPRLRPAAKGHNSRDTAPASASRGPGAATAQQQGEQAKRPGSEGRRGQAALTPLAKEPAEQARAAAALSFRATVPGPRIGPYSKSACDDYSSHLGIGDAFAPPQHATPHTHHTHTHHTHTTNTHHQPPHHTHTHPPQTTTQQHTHTHTHTSTRPPA